MQFYSSIQPCVSVSTHPSILHPSSWPSIYPFPSHSFCYSFQNKIQTLSNLRKENQNYSTFSNLPQVQQILEKLNDTKQTVMTSATIPPNVESMASKLLQDPVFISVGNPNAPTQAVKQLVLWVEENSKKRHLFSILKDPKHYRPPVVVFVDSKIGADMLAEAIGKVCLRKVNICIKEGVTAILHEVFFMPHKMMSINGFPYLTDNWFSYSLNMA